MDGSEEEQKIERLREAMYSRTLSEHLKARPRHEFEPEMPTVGEDFEEKEPGAPASVVAPRTIGIVRTALWWILAGAVVFCLGAVAFFGYYFVFGAGSGDTSSQNIDIIVSGPPQVQGGSATEFQITVTNRNKEPLDLAELQITFPPGTRNPTDYATPEPVLQQSLGTIAPGTTVRGVVQAVLSGNAGDRADLKVELDYHIGGSSAIFVASTDYTVIFSSSPLSIAVDGNSQTVSGQPVQLTVNVSSNVGAPVHDVLMKAQYPFGFKLSSANPPPSSDGLWHLGDLSPGGQDSVLIQGTLTGSQGDNRVFHFTAGTESSSTSGIIDTPLADESFPMTISEPFLGLAVTVDGATGDNIVVQPGDTVTVAINWQNNLQSAIDNAAIVAQLSGIQIDGTSVQSSDGFYRSADNVVLWDKTTDPELESIKPGASGTVSFSFMVPQSSSLQGIQDPRLDISINAAGDRVSQSGVPENLQAVVDQKIAVASDLKVTAQGLYYSNPFGSTGPMPPQANIETTYALVLSVTNTTNDLNNAVVTAELPPYVRWIGIYSPGTEKVYFDGKLYTQGQILQAPAGDPCQGTMGICWSIGDVPPGTGINGAPPKQVIIAVGFTPSTSQIGTQPALLQQIQIQGTDSSTGRSITRTAPDITTNIMTDPGFSAVNANVVAPSTQGTQ